jgi:frataxin-like iron-binding protein CyaY
MLTLTKRAIRATLPCRIGPGCHSLATRSSLLLVAADENNRIPLLANLPCNHINNPTLAHAFSSVVRRRRANNRDGIRPAPPPLAADPGEATSASDTVDLDEQRDNSSSSRKHRDAHTSPPVDFEPKARLFLDKIYAAMQPLIPINENMIVTRGEEQPELLDDDEELDESIVYGPFLLIDLGPVHGQYSLTADTLQGVLLFQSPISGQRHYKLHPTSGEWCCVQDGHNLEGLLVRDLIRQIQGVPNL